MWSVSAYSLLDRPVYVFDDVDRLLGLAKGTARRWIDGYSRGGRTYAPVIRAESAGDDTVTWGEFVETRLLAGFRRDVPMIRLRPAIQALREEFRTRYPLAHARPYIDAQGRELVKAIQDEVGLDVSLRLVVVRNGQMLLTEPAAQFRRSADFGEDQEVVQRLHPAPNIEEVWIDPNRQSGDPVVRGVPTSVLAELFRAGDSITQIADWYELQRTEVEAALRYEQLTAVGAA